MSYSILGSSAIRAGIPERIAVLNSGMIWLLALAEADLHKTLILDLG